MASGEKHAGKKEKGYYVPSRYKQAAEKYSILPNNSGETHLRSSRNSQSSQVSGNSSQDTLSCSKLSNSQEGKGMTSTPTSKEKCPFPSLDASAVTNCKGYLSVPSFKDGIGPLSSDNLKRNLACRNKLQNKTRLGPVVASHKNKKKNQNKKVEEANLNILYAEYLQAKYLEFEAQIALGKRSSFALEKIYKLFSLVIVHVEELQILMSKLKVQSSLIKIHHHCCKQEEIFGPVFEILPSLNEKYKNLEEAVNANKHKLSVKDVILPEYGSEGEIITQLEKANDVICDFFEKFTNIKEIISSAEIMQNYTDVGVQILDTLKKCSSLLVEAKELLLLEATLKLSCEKS